MQVVELWRYPVKSFQGERLDEVAVTAEGLEGDRGFALFDVESGLGLTGRRVPELLVVLDADGEDALVGSRVRLGEAVLDVDMRIERCVMTTRPQPGGIERDLDVLRTILRERDGYLAVGALVAEPGTIRVGDTLTPL